MKSFFAVVIIAVTSVNASASPVAPRDAPLPRSRPMDMGPADQSGSSHATPAPGPEIPAHPAASAPEAAPEPQKAAGPPPPSACDIELAAIAVAHQLPPITGPGGCGGPDMVRLDAVILDDKRHIAIAPGATLRCSMAKAFSEWVREDLAPSALPLGAALASVEDADSFECRGRNRVAGAKLSEHGKGNAIDVHAIKLANGVLVQPTDASVSKEFRDHWLGSVCKRFTTVLGPGSDGYHENHIHVDLAERHNGYRICHWEVRTQEEEVARRGVPVPAPRPTQAGITSRKAAQ